MKITIFSSKESQFFFYAYHMSKWHFSSMPEVGHMWVEQTGGLRKEEKEALKSLQVLFKKYGFGKKYIGNAFLELPNSKVEKGIYDIAGQKDGDLIKSSFEKLKPRFDILYRNDFKRLETLRKKMEHFMNRTEYMEILSQISRMFGVIKGDLSVCLLALPKQFDHIGGSANTNGSFLTLELRRTNDLQEGVLVVFHELTHKLVRENNLSFKTNIKIPESVKKSFPHFKFMTKEEALEELFLLSFLPDGFISKIYFRNLRLDGNVKKFSRELIQYMKNLAENKQKINQQVIKDFIKLLTKTEGS